MLGKILFVIVLPILGSCKSMVYRSVAIPNRSLDLSVRLYGV